MSWLALVSHSIQCALYTQSDLTSIFTLTPLAVQGFGKRLMYELEARTCAAGRPGRISSTVDARQPRLLEYYRRQGGTVEATGEAKFALRFRFNCQMLQWPLKPGNLGNV